MTPTYKVEGQILWLGLSAPYSTDERLHMAALTVREQTVLHVLKALTAGTLEGCGGPLSPPPPGGPPLLPLSTSETEKATFTDPEDLEFGSAAVPGKKKRPLLALVWTPNRHKEYKFKKDAEKRLRAWKRLYRYLGWTITTGQGYAIATKAGERRAISLREYDAATRQRVN